MKSIILVGYGYWGKILYSKITTNPNYNLIAIIDNKPLDLDINQYSSITEACSNHKIDSIIIATPAFTHKDLILEAIKNNINIWVEKPFVSCADEFYEIKDIVYNFNKSILVDHTFLSTPAFKKIIELLNDNFLGQIYKVDSIRTDFGLFQSDVSVFFHLMYHDFYIIDELFGISNLTDLKVICNSVIYKNLPDSAVVNFNIKDVNINIKCDMGFAKKERYFQIWGEKGILVWDEVKENKIQFYEYVVQNNDNILNYTMKNPINIEIENKDALSDRLNYFYKLNNKNNINQAERVIKLCEECNKYE